MKLKKFILIGSLAMILLYDSLLKSQNNYPENLDFKKLPLSLDQHVKSPAAVCVNKRGYYCVLGRKEHCIKVFGPDYIFSHQIGEFGQGPGELFYPEDFCMDTSNIIYVADTANKRIQYFSQEGMFLGGFDLDYRPRSIQVNSKGEIFIINPSEETGKIISVYTKKGKLLRNFGSFEVTKYKEDLINIALNYAYLLIDKEDNIFVAFRFIPKIRKYSSSEQLIFEREVSAAEIENIRKGASVPVANPQKGTISNISLFLRGIALGPQKNLLISLTTPYIYLYDSENGRKRNVFSTICNGEEISMHILFFTYQGQISGFNPKTGFIFSNLRLR
jgi:hypothetical protein